MKALLPGVVYVPTYLDRAGQAALVETLRTIVQAAPLFAPRMPRTGNPFSVRMTNCGPLGWVSDETGYRYQPTHPDTGEAWPPIPEHILRIWGDLAGYPKLPEACLVNVYTADARMGLHQDRDENDLRAPVLSISLGDTGIFRVGGTTRGSKTTSFRLASGDVVILGGEARLAFHGIDRIVPNTSTLVPGGGRINLTLRVVGARRPSI